jgi:DNA-directed RNA polymerase omega subunit
MKKSNTIPESANRFEFVTVASHRARQLLQGCTPRVEPEIKPARTALREVQVGAVKAAAAVEKTESR